MKMKCFLALLILGLITHSLHAEGQDAQARIEQAIEQLDHGIELLDQHPEDARQQITTAAAMIERIIKSDHIENPKLYHALGNAYMLTNQRGYAILAYRRGWQLDPTDQILMSSLEHARSMVPVQTTPDSTSRYWRYALSWRSMVSRQALWITFVLCMNLGFVCCSLALWKHPRRRIMYAGVFLLIFSALPLGMLLSEWYFLHAHHEVVLTQDQTIARAGPDDRIYDPVFSDPLPAGVEGDLLDTRNGWSHIQLHNGPECWVPSATIEQVFHDTRSDSLIESAS